MCPNNRVACIHQQLTRRGSESSVSSGDSGTPIDFDEGAGEGHYYTTVSIFRYKYRTHIVYRSTQKINETNCSKVKLFFLAFRRQIKHGLIL